MSVAYLAPLFTKYKSAGDAQVATAPTGKNANLVSRQCPIESRTNYHPSQTSHQLPNVRTKLRDHRLRAVVYRHIWI
jgi:hypothetical protein